MKNKMLYGAIILTGAGFIAKIIGAIYRVPLMSLIGTNGIGLYQLIFPVYALFLVISCSGIPLGLSKIISLEMGKENYANVKKIFKSSLGFMLVLGLVISIFLCTFANFFANLQSVSEAYICYFALAPAIILSCIISVYRGYFQGLQNMTPSAIVQIIEQLFKLIFALTLAKTMIKLGVVYGVLGTFIGISISELFALIYCLITYYHNKQNKKILKTKEKSTYSIKYCLKLVISNSFLIMINGVIIPLCSAIESLLIVWLLSKAGIGNELALRIYGLEDGIVGSLINMPIVIAGAIGTALIPSLAISYADKNQMQISTKCRLSLKYVWLISFPCAIIFFMCSDKIIYFLYSSSLNTARVDQFLIATNLLKFSAINIIYISILNLATALLQACNKSIVPVRNLLIASGIKIVLNFIFVTNATFNIYGLVITDIICFSLACILDLKYLKGFVSFSLDIKKEIVSPLISGLVMILIIKILNLTFSNFVGNRVLTILIILLSLLVYVICLFMLKAFSKTELEVLPKLKFGKKSFFPAKNDGNKN